jgi:hypothetical protein
MSAVIDYLNVPTEMLDQPIEPWTPKIGDRVRVVLNGECQFQAHPESHAAASGELRGHFDHEHGRTGTVVEPDHDAEFFAAQDHHYLVMYDEEVPLPDGYVCTGDYYAACELEPLS